MTSQAEEVRAAKRRQRDRVEVRKAVERLAKALGISPADLGSIDGYTSGAVVVRRGVWISLEAVDKVIALLEPPR